MHSQSSRKSILLTLVFIVLLWLGTFTAYSARNDIYDWWRLRGYVPSTDVARLADETTMNQDTRRTFYAYKPSIESDASFNEHCRDSEFTIVLGCYVQYQGIYIFKIDDARLQGIEQVTAAHELLHVAYDRMSSKERSRIDALTAEVFANIKDQRIKDTVAQYNDNDPSSVPNELHSILGTEVGTLPDELEKHYTQYFTNRSKIVSYSEQYEQAFSSRKSRIEQLERDLKDLKAKIETANRENEATHTYLSSRSDQLQSDMNRGSNTTQSEVDAYNREVEKYNVQVQRTSRLIDSYNAKYETYKNIVGEQNDLFSKIDSRPDTVKTQ